MNQYGEVNKGDWSRTIIYVLLFAAALVIGAIYLLPAYWYVWSILVVGGLFLLVRWHARSFAYHCPKCGHEFEISTVKDFVSPNGIVRRSGGVQGWKYLSCPKCHERVKALTIKKKSSSSLNREP
jgi:DNA-directed RNA polymerase subunit RPC12/RpoP